MIAQEITPRVQQWLRTSHSARVLHVFAAVCTLVNERGEVISLVSPAIGPGPFTAVLEGDLALELDVDQPVAIDGLRLTLAVGPLVVDMKRATLWQPRPDWSRLVSADVTTWPRAAALPARMDAALRLTVKGILADDAVTCTAGVADLAGRGAGLTPAGDDVLMGVLYGLWVWYPPRRQRLREEWLEMILEAAVPRTTTFSANFLHVARAGEATWQWHHLVNGSPRSVERILSIGHTSGADAWAGFTHTGSMLSAFLGHGVR